MELFLKIDFANLRLFSQPVGLWLMLIGIWRYNLRCKNNAAEILMKFDLANAYILFCILVIAPCEFAVVGLRLFTMSRRRYDLENGGGRYGKL